jgi:hypothetical protein
MNHERGTTHHQASSRWRGHVRNRQVFVTAALSAIVFGLSAAPAGFGGQQGTTWIERPDAGATLSTAQRVRGTGLLQSIKGSMRRPGPRADMYRICAGPNFSATTVGGANFDSQLFLFDKNGVGLYANDDSQGGVQSTLPASHPNGPNVRSEYFLAISVFDRDPKDASGKLIFPTIPFAQVVGRFTHTGPMTGFVKFPGPGGTYTIALQDAEFLNRFGRCVPQAASAMGSEHVDKP